LRAILIAASFASAPLLQKNTCPLPAPARSMRSEMRTAARVATGFAKKLETCTSVAACVLIASVTAGLQ
jgi:hypothetical protein